jgi:hypothetical protein
MLVQILPRVSAPFMQCLRLTLADRRRSYDNGLLAKLAGDLIPGVLLRCPVVARKVDAKDNNVYLILEVLTGELSWLTELEELKAQLAHYTSTLVLLSGQ